MTRAPRHQDPTSTSTSTSSSSSTPASRSTEAQHRPGRLRRAWDVLREAFEEWKEDDALAWGAALSLYSVLSLAPLLLISLAIAGMVWETGSVEDQMVSQVSRVVGDAGAETVRTILRNANESGGGGWAAALGIVTVLFAASGVFAQLQKALNRMWEVEPDPDAGVRGVIRTRLTAIGLVLAVGFLLLVSLVASAMLSAASGWVAETFPGGGALALPLDVVFFVALASVLFALILKVLPDVEISWRDVWVGAVSTAVLFAVGKVLIGLYLGRSAVGSA